MEKSNLNKLIKKFVKSEPAFKNILVGLWEVHEQTNGQLGKVASLLKEFQEKQIVEIKTEWHRATGLVISPHIENLAFNKPEIQAKFKSLEMLIEIQKCLAKAQSLSKILGLENLGPISQIKKSGCWRRGGLKRAEIKFKEAENRYEEYHKLFKKIKNQKGLSSNKIHEIMAKQLDKSKSHVYNTLKGDYLKK